MTVFDSVLKEEISSADIVDVKIVFVCLLLLLLFFWGEGGCNLCYAGDCLARPVMALIRPIARGDGRYGNCPVVNLDRSWPHGAGCPAGGGKWRVTTRGRSVWRPDRSSSRGFLPSPCMQAPDKCRPCLLTAPSATSSPSSYRLHSRQGGGVKKKIKKNNACWWLCG